MVAVGQCFTLNHQIKVQRGDCSNRCYQDHQVGIYLLLKLTKYFYTYCLSLLLLPATLPIDCVVKNTCYYLLSVAK